jgi:transcriptional regulator with XRE-family HTH domain
LLKTTISNSKTTKSVYLFLFGEMTVDNFASSFNIKRNTMENLKIGNKIAEARKKLNLSQAQLAQNLFISPQAVGKWERGESFPDIITFNRIAKILGVDLNYFSEDFESQTAHVESVEFVEQRTEIQTKKKMLWNMSRGNWVDADFSGLKDLQEKFSSSNMKNCKFSNSQLSGLTLNGNNVDSCNFSHSDFKKSQILSSNFVKNNFSNCSLEETNFSGRFIGICDFSNANLSFSQFNNGGFEKNILAGALLKNTAFNNMYLAHLIFENDIDSCYFESCAFKNVQFQNAVLKNTFFKCRNLKGLKFMNCQADRMTYEFLKNGKADLNGLSLID